MKDDGAPVINNVNVEQDEGERAEGTNFYVHTLKNREKIAQVLLYHLGMKM